jgi:hypothetical protein
MPDLCRLEQNACTVCCSSIMSYSSSHKKRGEYKKNYSLSDVLLAVNEYRSAAHSPRPTSISRVAARHNMPHQTLRDAIRRTDHAIATAPRYSTPSQVMETAVSTNQTGTHLLMLTPDVEQQLITYIDTCKALAHPVTIYHVRHKAKRLYFATHNTPTTDQNCNEMAGRRWWEGFKSRHPTFTLRAPQLLALQRARATQPEIINHFYDLLKLAYDTYQFDSEHIWAMDETGLDNNFKVSKVIARKGAYAHAQHEACHM